MDVIELYDGAYGPTIRISTNSRGVLEKLRGTFEELARAKAALECELRERLGIESEGGIHVIMAADHDARPAESSIVGVAAREFRWVQSPRAWDRCEGLVVGLLEAGRPGHQYLTREGVDAILVELAFLEDGWEG